MKLEHIGIAVESIEVQLKIWRDLFGFTVEMITDAPEQNVRVAMLDIGGVIIELLEPKGEDSVIRKFIDKKGEGLHHLSFEVEDIERAIEDLKGRDVKMIDEVSNAIFGVKPRTIVPLGIQNKINVFLGGLPIGFF